MMDDPEKKRSSRIKSRKWEPSELEAIFNYIKDSAERDLCVEKPTSSAFLEKLLKDLNWKNIEYSQLKNKMFKLRKSYIDAMLWRDQNGPVVEDDSLLYNQLLEMCPHFDLFSKIYDGRINYKKYAPKQSPTHSISNDTTSQNFISNTQQTIPTRMLMDCAVISIDSLGKIVHRCLICNQTIESLPIAHIRSHFKDLFECHICQKSCDSLEFLVEHVNLFHAHEVPNSEDGDPLDIADLEIENVDFEPRLDTQSDHDNYCENIMSLSDKNNDDATLKDNIYHQTRDISNEGNAFDSPDGTNLVIDHEESIQSLGNDEDSLKPTKTTNLLNFEAVRNDSGQREYPCQICRAKFKTKHRLKEHFLTVHLRYKKFQCEICGKQFGGKNNLLRHTLVHKDQSQKEMQECSVCEKKFSEKGNLIQHMRSHTGEKPYKCAVCDKSFSHSSYVRTHMKIHTGERPYKCTLCDSEFRTTGELNYHMQKHKNDKPFKCDYCDKRFYLNRDLKDHTNTHTGDRPYQCKDCSRKFAKWSTLRQHEKLHKDKSYSCDQCGRRFAQDAGWRNHVTRGRCSTRNTLSSDSKNCSQRPSIHTVDALDGSNVDVPNDSEAGSLSGDLQTDDYENEL